MKSLKRVLLTTTAMAYAAAVLSFAEPIVAFAEENETQDVTTDVTDVTDNSSNASSTVEGATDEATTDASAEASSTEDAQAQTTTESSTEGETVEEQTTEELTAEEQAALQAALLAADPVGYDYDFTMEELVLMANVVYREARGSFNGQVAVAEVIMNRVMSPAYPNTIEGVLSQKGQFSTYSWASKRTVEETSPEMINLCLKVLSGENSYLNNANILSFKRNDGSQTFYGKTLYTVVDNQAFYSI
ncbi:MAG: cell wall hydrolase [Butyrivibrio sp.]|uniref:cell wall hydrolase n=1 Tax=Butyrivibrio sp. TaxID=28121 RepID=UPI0025E7AFDA|nr:cell wall hydrolase [Butyrivibrio sp.]MCR5771535.1 cell wall hydrolase [Butyrivibrio sp.]